MTHAVGKQITKTGTLIEIVENNHQPLEVSFPTPITYRLPLRNSDLINTIEYRTSQPCPDPIFLKFPDNTDLHYNRQSLYGIANYLYLAELTKLNGVTLSLPPKSVLNPDHRLIKNLADVLNTCKLQHTQLLLETDCSLDELKKFYDYTRNQLNDPNSLALCLNTEKIKVNHHDAVQKLDELGLNPLVGLIKCSKPTPELHEWANKQTINGVIVPVPIITV